MSATVLINPSSSPPNTSKPAPGHRIYPYLLRNLPVAHPTQVWAMGPSGNAKRYITYIPMARGFVYLAAIIDWFSRRIVDYEIYNAPRN